MNQCTGRSSTRVRTQPVRGWANQNFADLAASASLAACFVVAGTVPLLFDPRAERVFDEPKILILRSVALLAAAALLTWVIENRHSLSIIASQARHARVLLASAAILTAAYVTASVLSIAPRIAWEGAYVRRQGTYTFLSYIAFFLVVCFFFRTRCQIQRLLLTFVLASVFPTAYAICQRFGFDLVLWNNPTPSRVTSTAGNSIFLGGYLIMVWPITLAHAVQTGRRLFPKQPMANTPIGCKLATLSSLALLGAQTAAIIFTGSVGVWLALAAAILVLLCILLNGVRRLRTRIGLVIIALVGIGALGHLASARRPIDSTSTSKASQMSSGASRSGEVRLVLWRSAVKLLQEKPTRALVGYGPDTIRLTLGRYQPVGLRKLEGPATADRSHNGVLDTTLTIGLLGLLGQTMLVGTLCVYAMRGLGLVRSAMEASCLAASIALSLVVLFMLAYQLDHGGGLLPLGWAGGLVAGMLFFLLVRGVLSRKAVPWEAVGAWQAALMAGVVGHYVEIQTGIATATSELYFWLFAGLIVATVQPDGETVSPVVGRERKAVSAEVPSNRAASTNAIVLGVISGLLLAIMTFDFGDRLIESRSMLTRFGVFVGVVLVMGAALRWCADIVLSADTTARSRINARVTFFAASLGIWLTFLTVSTLWVVLQGGAVEADPEVARLTHRGVGLLVGLCVTVFTACAVIAGSRRASDGLNRAERTGLSGRRVVVPVLLFITVVPIAVFRNLDALRADELSRLGTVLMSSEQWQRAESFYTRALLLQPTRDAYYAKLGQMLIAAFRSGTRDQTARLERARHAYVTAHQLSPFDPDHLLQLATVESLWAGTPIEAGERRRHLDNASQHLSEAARLAPRDPQVWNDWGKIRLREEDFPDAVTLFERSLSLDDTSPDPHLFYADALLGSGRYEHALREYETAQTLGFSESLPVISGRALALVRLNRLAEAVEANTQALKIAPEDYTSRKNLALLYGQLGNLNRAVSFAVAAAAVADASQKPAIETFLGDLQARLRADQNKPNPAAVTRRK